MGWRTGFARFGVNERNNKILVFQDSALLPRGCTTVVIEGTTLHQCGGTYYQPSGNQYVVVNIN
jgi:hypothetical protein